MCSGEIFILAAVIGLIPATIAHNKGYNFFAWWLFGALLFIVALPIALITEPNQWRYKKCPYCAESIKIEAILCRYCGNETSQEQSHNERTQTHNNNENIFVKNPKLGPPDKDGDKEHQEKIDSIVFAVAVAIFAFIALVTIIVAIGLLFSKK